MPPRSARAAAAALVAAGCGGAPATPAPAPPAPTAPAPSGPATLELTSAPEKLAPITSEYSEIRLAVSPDGATLLWGSGNRPGGAGGYDIWVVRRDGAGWTAPAPAPFNTASRDFDPAFSHDGRFVYFFSDRPGGLGGDDIYRAPVTATGFGPAEHLDASINTPGNEWAPAPLADGSLLFCSNGRGGRGRQDLFLAAPRGPGFAPAAPLPGDANTPGDDFDATGLPSGDIILSRTTNIDTDPVSLVFSRRTAAGFDAGTPLPPPVLVDGWTFAPSVDPRDPTILYYSQRTRDSQPGTHDVFAVHYRIRR